MKTRTIKFLAVFQEILEAPTPQNGQTHSQTIRRLLPSNCLSVFDHFVGLTLKRINLFRLTRCKDHGRLIDLISFFQKLQVHQNMLTVLLSVKLVQESKALKENDILATDK